MTHMEVGPLEMKNEVCAQRIYYTETTENMGLSLIEADIAKKSHMFAKPKICKFLILKRLANVSTINFHSYF